MNVWKNTPEDPPIKLPLELRLAPFEQGITIVPVRLLVQPHHGLVLLDLDVQLASIIRHPKIVWVGFYYDALSVVVDGAVEAAAHHHDPFSIHETVRVCPEPSFQFCRQSLLTPGFRSVLHPLMKVQTFTGCHSVWALSLPALHRPPPGFFITIPVPG